VRFFPNQNSSPIPGFGLTLGISLSVLGFFVLLPILGLTLAAGGVTLSQVVSLFMSDRVLAALSLTLTTSLLAAFCNLLLGLLVAWVLCRYSFWGKSILNGMVDLPFALPTAVAGIALTTLYSPNGWLGAPLAQIGIYVAYTPIGIWLALLFVGFPFVVRTVQPVLANLPLEVEEAAATLGAGQLRTFLYVIFPAILPAMATGFGLALARGLGEYGSVVFISGNLPNRTEIIPLLIMSKLESFDRQSAVVLALGMLLLSLLVLMMVQVSQRLVQRVLEGRPL